MITIDAFIEPLQHQNTCGACKLTPHTNIDSVCYLGLGGNLGGVHWCVFLVALGLAKVPNSILSLIFMIVHTSLLMLYI